MTIKNVGNEAEGYDFFDIDAVENPEPEMTDESEDFFLLYYADFMNRMAHYKFLPYSTVQEISEEYLKNSKKSQEICARKLRDSLGEVESLSNEDVENIVKDVVGDDFFIKAQEKLCTQYKRTKFVEENMNYVAPVEIILNKSEVDNGQAKDVLHYIPLDVALKNLLEDRSLVKLFEEEEKMPPKDATKITDILDGSLYKSNPFFKENKDALSLLFYSDGVELKNPLGAARGVYKIVQVFYTLVNIPKEQRSQVDRLQLCMVYREKLLKKYSFNVIYRALINDLKKLENGITVNCPEPKVVKAGLLLHAADNLEAHLIGGFSGSFSSKSVCRFCHLQHSQLEENIHDFSADKPHDRWTVAEYDYEASFLEEENAEVEIIESLVEDEDDEQEDDQEDPSEDSSEEDNVRAEFSDLEHGNRNRWGLKRNCPLNTLKAFHCVSGLLPDVMHDHLEGVVAEDLLSIIKDLVNKRWFSIEQYNNALKSFGWYSYEKMDRPQPVPVSKKILKLKGKACSLWVHVRNFPLLVEKFVIDSEDEMLNIGLKLHEVTESIMATEFLEYEVQLLEECVVDYLELRRRIRSQNPDSFNNRNQNIISFRMGCSQTIKCSAF